VAKVLVTVLSESWVGCKVRIVSGAGIAAGAGVGSGAEIGPGAGIAAGVGVGSGAEIGPGAVISFNSGFLGCNPTWGNATKNTHVRIAANIFDIFVAFSYNTT
jgi:UDP-3-O-[3-hydroxymyristoyl] glucosamine N-acyltransferase